MNVGVNEKKDRKQSGRKQWKIGIEIEAKGKEKSGNKSRERSDVRKVKNEK